MHREIFQKHMSVWRQSKPHLHFLGICNLSKIKEVLPSTIHHNQTEYTKDRYNEETTRLIFDIMDFTLNENISGLMIFIDFHKVFDTLEWDYLYKCLEAFNFGEDFIRWVKTFYKNIESCVLNNGFFSEYFKLERGVRQGDPLPPNLFVLAIETLAVAIRQNSEIKGIVIEKKKQSFCNMLMIPQRLYRIKIHLQHFSNC